MSFDPAVFFRQLRYWTLHCLLNALPSLGIALGWMELWKRPPAVAAMFTAIATFILLYAVLTTLAEPLHDSFHILGRSLKLGTRLRAWISGLSLLLVPTGFLVMFTPDYWCGTIAIGLVNRGAVLLGWGNGQFFDWEREANSGFLPVYVVTLTEGILLSFLLLMISFFALLFLQARERKKIHASA